MLPNLERQLLTQAQHDSRSDRATPNDLTRTCRMANLPLDDADIRHAFKPCKPNQDGLLSVVDVVNSLRSTLQYRVNKERRITADEHVSDIPPGVHITKAHSDSAQAPHLARDVTPGPTFGPRWFTPPRIAFGGFHAATPPYPTPPPPHPTYTTPPPPRPTPPHTTPHHTITHHRTKAFLLRPPRAQARLFRGRPPQAKFVVRPLRPHGELPTTPADPWI